ncbi:MAG: hypothetical protein HQ463_03280 [Bacteroidetes bacterium]|nr:hypothetical protein [Bacteroidota bacterium]
MNKKKIIVLVLLSAGVIYSCKDKNKDPEPPKTPVSTKTKQQFLSDTTWKVSGFKASGTDIWNTPFVSACDKDNTYKFKLSNVLTSFDLPSKCNPTDPDSTNSAYKLIGNDKMYINLKLTGTIIIDDTSDINVLDATTMELKVKYSGIDGVVTFKH